MKILNSLTLKHLAMNKKRTIVTIIGIILSTSLMVGIGLLISTVIKGLRETEIENHGSHHVTYSNLTKQDVDILEENINFNDTYYFGTVAFASIQSSNEAKPYLFIASADEHLLKTETLTEGRFPKTNEEIVLPNHYTNSIDKEYKIGDKITLSIGYRLLNNEKEYSNRIGLDYLIDEDGNFKTNETFIETGKKTYTIVGFIERSNKEKYQAPGYMSYTTKETNLKEYTLYGTYKNIKKTFTLSNEISKNLSENATYETNDSLLYYYGVSRYSNINDSMISVFAIMLSLVSIGCIIVIYNSFAISTMERKKSFGLYASLGATPKQIKYTVFFEAFVVGSIGIILGILGAFLGIYIVVKILDYLLTSSATVHLTFAVEPIYVFIPILFMILVVFLSSYLPAKRASKITPISLIRENDDIKIPKKKIKTPRWIETLFGMEGVIALKNIKRNKKKYRITILSLFISIVLFISFSAYLQVGINITDANELPSYDILVETKNEDILKEITNMEGVTEYHDFKETTIFTNLLEPDIYQKDYFNYIQKNTSIYVNALIVDQDLYDEIRNEANIQDQDILVLNEINFTYYTNNSRKTYQVPIFAKEMTKLKFYQNEEEEKEVPVTLISKVEGLKKINVTNNMFTIIMTEEQAKEFSFYDEERNTHFLALFTNNLDETYQKIEEKYQNKSKDINYYSPKKELKSTQNAILAIQILLYGFISLVTLTGITSVFNTIHTSIHLRKKEFAMLRSIGLSPKGFNKMIFFESLFFGLKSLFYSLPVSFVLVYLINLSISDVFYFGELSIPWNSILISIVGVFIIVLLTMMYSVKKIKKENILDALREENI